MQYAIYKSPNSNGKIIPIEKKEQIEKILGRADDLRVFEGLVNKTIIIGKYNKGEINFIYKTQDNEEAMICGDCVIIKGEYETNTGELLSEEEAKILVPLFNNELLLANSCSIINDTLNEVQKQINMLKIEMAMRGLFINEGEDEEEDMDL
jgi:hypothetical protein